MVTCDYCDAILEGHLAVALGWCAECDAAPEEGDVPKGRRSHGRIVAPRCRAQRGAHAGACRGALRWSGPASDGEVYCEAHWIVAEGYDYDEALFALGEADR